MVGVGGISQLPISARGKFRREGFSFTLGPRTEQNPYTGHLTAIAYALRALPMITDRNVAVITNNKAAVISLGNPRQQSGQAYLLLIYEAIEKLRERGNRVAIEWIPVRDENELLKMAKTEAREATKDGATPQRQFPRMRSTTLNIQKQKLKAERCLPEKVGKHAKRIDAALPGNHTRLLYNELPWKERSVLAQLRTGMSALNNYLYQIKRLASDQCRCGRERETVAHFLFRCSEWSDYREDMLQCTKKLRGNLSFYLGGKSPSDGPKWKPNMRAVRATIRFVMATGRLDN